MEVTTIDHLAATESAIADAARRGDTRTLRTLKSQRQDLVRHEQREVADLQARMQSRKPPVEAPRKGEEKRLADSEHQILAELTRLETVREKALIALAKRPDRDALSDKLDSVEDEIKNAGRQLEAVRTTQAQIEQWHEERRREARQQQEAQDLKTRRAEQAELERKAASLKDSIIGKFNGLLSDLAELDKTAVLHMKLTGHQNHCQPVDDARIAIAKGTNHAIRFEDGGRYPNKWLVNHSQEVKSAK